MKLIALRFQGVGPYRGEFAVDFAALSARHMFLIDGETGAGKTTILDCITFALYGSISGNSDGRGVGDRDRIRSRFLSDSPEETYVDLIFRIGDDYYEILRKPDYDRPKRRGEGTTHNPASARMLHLDEGFGALADESRAAAMQGVFAGEGSESESGGDGDGDETGSTGGRNAGRSAAERYFTYAQEPGHATVVTTSVREVTAEVERLLGLDRGQFSKTVILAQGRFAEFLRMKPEDRTGLVRDLFSAGEYEDIQRRLEERRQEGARKVDDLRSRLRDAAGQAMRNAGAILAELGSDGDCTDAAVSSAAVFAEPVGSESGNTGSAGSGAEGSQAGDPESAGHASPAFWGLDDAGDVDEAHHEPARPADVVATAVAAVAEDSRRLVSGRRTNAEDLDAAWSDLRNRQTRLTALVDAAKAKRDAAQKAERVHALDADIAGDEQACRDAERARPVAEAHGREETDRHQLDDLTGRLQHARKRLDEFESAEELDRLIAEAVTAAAGEETARKAREVAEGHAALLDRVTKARRTHQKAQNDHDTAEKAVADAEKARKALPDAVDIDRRREDLTRRIADRDHLQERLDQAKQILRHARKRDEVAKKVVELEKSAADAAEARRLADETYEQARRRFDEAGASRLAATLEDGRPCPVCGSLEHPHPATSDEDAPGKPRLASLKRRAADALAAWEKAQTDLSTAKATLAAETAACEGLSVEDAGTAADALTAQIDAAGDLDGRLSDCKDQAVAIAKADKAVQDARTHLAESDARLDAARQSMDAAVAAAEGITADGVATERRDAEENLKTAREQAGRAETLKARRAKRDEFAKEKERLQATREEVAKRVDADARDTSDALESSGFADLDAALAAVLDAAQIEKRRRGIDAHRREAAAADAAVETAGRTLEKRRADLDSGDAAVVAGLVAAQGVAEGAVQGAVEGTESDAGSTAGDGTLAGDGTPIDDDALALLDLTPFDDRVVDAQAKRDLALRALETAEGLERQREECGRRATEAAAAFSTGMAAFLPVRDMALLASGSTPNAEGQKITLVTYAVTERFRDVLDRANDLLRDIHDGVYELRLGDHEGRAGGRTGLPIEVYDRRSDTTCEPATLSGGETFFVSLALALALADVIRAEAGGTAMDTLFVDEGFGSLSQDYLDEVMEVLRGIARTRDVGIISHVGQLREQIGPRISVSRVREDAESRLEVVL